MGPGKYGNVGKSQSVLIMINSMIFTRTRNPAGAVELVCGSRRYSNIQQAKGANHTSRPFDLPADVQVAQKVRSTVNCPNGQLPPLNGHTRTQLTNTPAPRDFPRVACSAATTPPRPSSTRR
jgi:hypothetical protein